jgi:hypothetical protein
MGAREPRADEDDGKSCSSLDPRPNPSVNLKGRGFDVRRSSSAERGPTWNGTRSRRPTRPCGCTTNGPADTDINKGGSGLPAEQRIIKRTFAIE